MDLRKVNFAFVGKSRNFEVGCALCCDIRGLGMALWLWIFLWVVRLGL